MVFLRTNEVYRDKAAIKAISVIKTVMSLEQTKKNLASRKDRLIQELV